MFKAIKLIHNTQHCSWWEAIRFAWALARNRIYFAEDENEDQVSVR